MMVMMVNAARKVSVVSMVRAVSLWSDAGKKWTGAGRGCVTSWMWAQREPLHESSRAVSTAACSPSSVRGVHLLRCPDGIGHVAAIAALIARRGGTLVSCDIHVDNNSLSPSPSNSQQDNGTFFSRTVFEFPVSSWSRLAIEEEFGNLASQVQASHHSLRVPSIDKKRKMGIMVGRGYMKECLYMNVNTGKKLFARMNVSPLQIRS